MAGAGEGLWLGLRLGSVQVWEQINVPIIVVVIVNGDGIHPWVVGVLVRVGPQCPQTQPRAVGRHRVRHSVLAGAATRVRVSGQRRVRCGLGGAGKGTTCGFISRGGRPKWVLLCRRAGQHAWGGMRMREASGVSALKVLDPGPAAGHMCGFGGRGVVHTGGRGRTSARGGALSRSHT